MGSKQKFWSNIWPPTLVIIVVIVIWQLIVANGLVYSWLIPSPVAVVQEMIEIWPRLAGHTAATLKLTAIGYVGGAVAGMLLASILHFLPGVRKAIYPLLILSQNIPLIVIAPIITMLLGYGMLPKVLLIVLVCFFPICVGMLGGLAHADFRLKNYLHMIGGTRWQMFLHVELPNSMTSVFSGLKIAASYSVLSTVVAEWLSPNTGLGAFMILSSRGYMPERVFAAVVFIVFISLALFWIVTAVEYVCIRWQPRQEEK